MNCIYLIIVLSDTVGGGGRVGAPGLRTPHDYHWLQELRVYHMDGRIFNLALDQDRADLNAISQNAFRAHHRHHYPVPRVLTRAEVDLLKLPHTLEPPVMESGFDEPAPASSAPVPVEDEPISRTPEAMITNQAKREAQKLGVDIASIKGSGLGGIITKDDVLRAWQGGNHAASQSTPAAGQVSMAELMGAN